MFTYTTRLFTCIYRYYHLLRGTDGWASCVILYCLTPASCTTCITLHVFCLFVLLLLFGFFVVVVFYPNDTCLLLVKFLLDLKLMDNGDLLSKALLHRLFLNCVMSPVRPFLSYIMKHEISLQHNFDYTINYCIYEYILFFKHLRV